MYVVQKQCLLRLITSKTFFFLNGLTYSTSWSLQSNQLENIFVKAIVTYCCFDFAFCGWNLKSHSNIPTSSSLWKNSNPWNLLSMKFSRKFSSNDHSVYKLCATDVTLTVSYKLRTNTYYSFDFTERTNDSSLPRNESCFHLTTYILYSKLLFWKQDTRPFR